jgi:hypothetical protein
MQCKRWQLSYFIPTVLLLELALLAIVHLLVRKVSSYIQKRWRSQKEVAQGIIVVEEEEEEEKEEEGAREVEVQ